MAKPEAAEPEKSIFDLVFERLRFKRDPTTAQLHAGIDRVNALILDSVDGFEAVAENYNKTMDSLEAAKQKQPGEAPEAAIERLRKEASQQLSSLTELAGTIGKDIEASRTYPSYKAVSHRFKAFGPANLTLSQAVRNDPSLHREVDKHSITLLGSPWLDLPNVDHSLKQAMERAAKAGVEPQPVRSAAADVSPYNANDGPPQQRGNAQ